jgi:class 3 adenylate cyclase
MPSVSRLTAILAADVAGYSRLMGTDEEGTHERLKTHRQALVDPTIAGHRGRILKTTGDGHAGGISGRRPFQRTAAHLLDGSYGTVGRPQVGLEERHRALGVVLAIEVGEQRLDKPGGLVDAIDVDAVSPISSGLMS